MDLTTGVLQGEILSPIRFSLFIADLETYLQNKGIRGVSIDHQSELLNLAYADDLVLFVDSPARINRLLGAPHDYSSEYQLNVNIDKTKIIIFRREGHFHLRNYNLFTMANLELT